MLTTLARFAVTQAAKQKDDQVNSSFSFSPSLVQQNRKRLRNRLAMWYQDFLRVSLDSAVWLDLDLAERPDAIYTPLSLSMWDAHPSERPFPPGTSIIQIYHDSPHGLLIIGEPGSGKSTLLYILAQHLLTSTETNQTMALPIIFSLSSWAQHQTPLNQWMVEQLIQIYKVPKQIAQQWVQDQQIIPLLDGLDEMELEARPLCVAAINRYYLEHPHPLVVCSRSREYDAALNEGPLVLQRAVVIQPLTSIQITTTLLRGGEQLAGLYTAYQTNPALQEIATSPLFLNLLILAYRGTSIHELSTKQEVLKQQVLERYIRRMVGRKGNPSGYPLSVTVTWLAFLARQMQVRKQTVFAIELLQTNWLPERLRWLYYLSLGLPLGLLIGTSGLSTGSHMWLFLGFGLFITLIVGMRAMSLDEGRGEPGVLERRHRREEQFIEEAQHSEWSRGKEHKEVLKTLLGSLYSGLLIGSPFVVLLVLLVLLCWLSFGWVS